jgi:hypothetical protein
VRDEQLARAAVGKYLDLINSGRYAEIGSLFAADAVFQAPTGEVIRGRERITAFYSSALQKIRPTRVWASSQVTEGLASVIEISAVLPDGPDPHTVVDHFTVDRTGEVARMAVYLTATELAETASRLGPEE